MSPLVVHQIPVMTDNYIYVLINRADNSCAVVDPAEAEPVLSYLQAEKLNLKAILNTHHHYDHVGGNKKLVNKTGCDVYGAKIDADRIPHITHRVADGENFSLLSQTFTVFETPGHTNGHICFYIAECDKLFCGDTLFALGCGRLFEGTPQQMWHSLSKLKQLPDQTEVYCTHEYTLDNAKFALSIDPTNQDLIDRFESIKTLRSQKKPTVPFTLAADKLTNPFLRADQDDIKRQLGLKEQPNDIVFACIRQRKDTFKA